VPTGQSVKGSDDEVYLPGRFTRLLVGQTILEVFATMSEAHFRNRIFKRDDPCTEEFWFLNWNQEYPKEFLPQDWVIWVQYRDGVAYRVESISQKGEIIEIGIDVVKTPNGEVNLIVQRNGPLSEGTV
jgi:hypothetical protein